MVLKYDYYCYKKIMVYLLVIIFIIIPLFFLSLYENPIMVQQIYKKYRWVIKNRAEGGISLFRLNLEIEVIYFQHFQYKDFKFHHGRTLKSHCLLHKNDGYIRLQILNLPCEFRVNTGKFKIYNLSR